MTYTATDKRQVEKRDCCQNNENKLKSRKQRMCNKK